MIIRKVSIGPDYKGGAMHYIQDQPILNDTYKIHLIKFDDDRGSIKIYIINDLGEVLLWKEFNSCMPISIEYKIDF
jgi:hypothetical protein